MRVLVLVLARRAQVIFDDIMRWLYSLHLRAPESNVMLVANQCDGTGVGNLESTVVGSTPDGDDFARTAGLVEGRVQELLKEWHDRRGILGNGQATGCRRGAAGVTLLPQV